MIYKVEIKENALDSFNEALAKYEQGEQGKPRAYKFAILHMAHFLELVLKMYVQSLDENLIFLPCFRGLEKKAKEFQKENLLEVFNELYAEDGIPFNPNGFKYLNTITVDDAIKLVKNERCQKTNNLFVDQEFINDIQWLKELRNNIEHFKFEITPRDVRLCLGRLVWQAEVFAEIFNLFDLAKEVEKESSELYHALIDEYLHERREAKVEVTEQEREAFRGIRPKHHQFVNWNVFKCPECNENTLIPNPDSGTGYRCTYCKNEDSDEIEVACDCCGALNPNSEMDQWPTEDAGFEWRCHFCTGEYAASRDYS
jgi:hypothetical protein